MKKDKYLEIYSVKNLLDAIKEAGSFRGAARMLCKRNPDKKANYSGMRSFLTRKGIVFDMKPTGGYPFHKRFREETKPVAGGTVHAPDATREKLKGRRFVFTAAQNNTYVHKGFFSSLKKFCEHNNAQLVVSRFAYNQSGFQNNSKDSEELWYDKKINPFVMDKSLHVAVGLVFGGELDILPSAVDPLSGLGNYFGSSSGIVPHTKVAMQSQARLRGEDARFLYTTGAITLRNYIQRKAGQKAEFHHVYGALYVEVDSKGLWFARQLIADNNGDFHDLTSRYTSRGVQTNQRVEAINWGDIHVEKGDSKVSGASWILPGSMLNILKPEYQFVHDLTDFSARNHHNINDPYFLASKYFKHESSVESDLDKSAEWLDNISRRGKVIVVESNHHEAYERWLKEAKIHHDPVNAEFFHESNARLFKSIRLNESFDVYEWALRRKKELKNVKFLKSDESFVICGTDKAGKVLGGIECGIHGHRGINGARGSSKSFRSVGRRVNVGHSHSCGIVDGVYTAGVSAKLDMGYNKGPSSWSHSHIVTYPNGKRCIVTIKNGKWRV